MKDPQIWTEDIAINIAKEDGINELTTQHWSVINVIRQLLRKRNGPMIRTICKETGLKLRHLRTLSLGPARELAV